MSQIHLGFGESPVEMLIIKVAPSEFSFPSVYLED